ncbi:MAG: hypothetical protein ACT4NY_25420, partial [Pseudonocardiales bacterium]
RSPSPPPPYSGTTAIQVQHRTTIRNRIPVTGTPQSTIRNRMLAWVGGEDRTGPQHGRGP